MILATTNANGGLCQEGENEMRKGNVKAINHNILKKYSKRQFCHSLCMVGWMMEHQRSNLQPVHQQQILTHQGKIVCWFSLIPSTVLVYVSLFGLFFFFTATFKFLLFCLPQCLSLCHHSLYPRLSHTLQPSLYFLTFLLPSLSSSHLCSVSCCLWLSFYTAVIFFSLSYSPLFFCFSIYSLLFLTGWWFIHPARH